MDNITKANVSKKRLSILISDYRTPGLTDRLLFSIFSAKSGFNPKLDEVIVVNDGLERNRGLDKVLSKYKTVIYLKNSSNMGFVGSYNKLIKASRGELILLLNSDIEVKPGALTTLVNISNHFHNKVALAGKLLLSDGRIQDSVFALPTIWGVVHEYFFNKKYSFSMYHPAGDTPVRVEVAVMACYLIPRSIINEVGLLNPKLFMYFEDVDYARRLNKAGVPLYYCPQAEFIHHHGASAHELGDDRANKQLIASAKIYHGRPYYYLLTAALWLGQKFQKLIHRQ